MFEEEHSKNYTPLQRLRHSTAHLMASAVKELYPNAKLSIGPATETGFYYDFDLDHSFSTQDLAKIEKRMRQIAAKKKPFQRVEVSKEEAKKFLQEKGETYKLEILKSIPDGETITYYQHGEFIDLCEGPHVEDTSQIGAFKLLSVAGAYWRGDESKPMLQRIYGTAFFTQKELDDYLELLAEAEKRDHRKLGKELDLFSSMENLGPGLILWHPKGAMIRQIIEDFWRAKHQEHNYLPVYTPHMAKLELWKISGHADFYQENMYTPMEVEGQDYEIKPMNCPFHVQIYQSQTRSYRDLPLRYGELGTVYRFERSGVLHGLLRVRGFTQDDAHLFCRPDQIQEEVEKVLDLTKDFLGSFGFTEFELYLSTRPEKSVGSDQNWEIATQALRGALEAKGLKFQVDPGEGVFYGPKIDLKIKDAIGRLWQCSTVQVDFNNPERFALSYIDQGGKKQQPIMLHRALMGSLERFFGILIEHYAGAFPAWLAPTQVKILPISQEIGDYVQGVEKALKKAGFRVELGDSGDKLGQQIRQAQLQKVPHMLVIGKKEAQDQVVAWRSRQDGDQGTLSLEDFMGRLQTLTKNFN
ncbi:MAG: threonine--tRNA ligase [Deltaproteobacteria bacterium]|nr:threonine--tRNA ligase [Deltaproteobacteria bacterium]